MEVLQEVIQGIQVRGKEVEKWERKAYWVSMINKSGNVHRIKALGIDTITSAIQPVDISGVIDLLKVSLRDVTRQAGPINP